MPHHYPKNTLEVSYYCNTCRKTTMHQVSNGSLGPCKEHAPKIKEPKPENKQEELFK